MSWAENGEKNRSKQDAVREARRLALAKELPLDPRRLYSSVEKFALLVTPVVQGLSREQCDFTALFSSRLPFEDRFYEPAKATLSKYSSTHTGVKKFINQGIPVEKVESFVFGRRFTLKKLSDTGKSIPPLIISLYPIKGESSHYGSVEIMITLGNHVRSEVYEDDSNALGIQTSVQTAVDDWIQGKFAPQSHR